MLTVGKSAINVVYDTINVMFYTSLDVNGMMLLAKDVMAVMPL